MQILIKSLTLGLLLISVPLLVLADTYMLDSSHTGVSFKVKHMVISKVKGQFDNVSGSFEFEPGDPKSWSVEASIDATSVNTGNDKRDDHLRSADFLDTETHPTLTFKSTGVKSVGEDEFEITGDLTIHGVTKSVTLDLEFNGALQDPWGNDRAGFSASTEINREDFGLTWSKALETGGLVVGDTVEIEIEAEGIKKK